MKTLLILGAFSGALCLAAGPTHAQMMLQKAVISSGGNNSASTSNQMGSTAGQPVIGVASNGQMIAHFGFWTPSAAASGVQASGPAPTIGIETWPNPATDASKLTVTVPATSDLDVRLYDVTGKEVQSVYRGAANGSLALNLDLSNLPAGSYILAARIPGQLIEKRISVIR